MNKKEEILHIIEVLGELSDWNLPDMIRFLIEKKEDWVGLSPMQLIGAGKSDSVLKFLERCRDGDPLS